MVKNGFLEINIIWQKIKKITWMGQKHKGPQWLGYILLSFNAVTQCDTAGTQFCNIVSWLRHRKLIRSVGRNSRASS